ncbi:MAG: protein TolQ [Polyangiales bacterium]
MAQIIPAKLATEASVRVADAGPAAAASAQLDPWQLVLDATLVVQLVMGLLVLMSVICWFIIGAKWLRVSRASHVSGRFLDHFWDNSRGSQWNTERLEGVYNHVRHFQASPLAAVFRAGYVELARMTGVMQSTAGSGPQRVSPGDLGNVERALRRAGVSEMTRLETMMPFLATTGSTAPFIGLFGTVWGIMNSFLAIGAQKNASLDVVAPGIAEALIATAIGLVAAIPAVMAYNYFVRRIRVLESEIESFSNDYLNVVRRHFLHP